MAGAGPAVGAVAVVGAGVGAGTNGAHNPVPRGVLGSGSSLVWPVKMGEMNC